MISNRRIAARPYFFELFAVANLVVVLAAMHRSRFLVGSIVEGISAFAIQMALQGFVGVLIRCAVAWYRRDRAYFRIIRSAGWLTDTARILLFGGVAIFTYAWIKLVIPLYHPVLLDQRLWDLDQTLLGGLSPNILILDLLSNPLALKAIDWSYANIFLASITVAFGFFISAPSRRLRIAFTNGNVALWLLGAWLYLAFPSIGPAYRFPDVWMIHEHALARTQHFQALLMRNYQTVMRVANGHGGGEISILYGIAAFPSMHVAFQTFVFLWMRRLWTSGEVLFGIFAFVIFLGSMVTGWHYLIDGIAGIVLAAGCYAIVAKTSRLSRWLAIKNRP